MVKKYIPKPSVSRVCRFCDTCFETTRPFTVYCSRPCAQAYAAGGYAARNPRYNVPTGTVGTIAELAVSVDLLRKGFSVFRALSPSCNCDLAVLFDRKLCRVEVKTAHLSAKGDLYWPSCDGSKYDVLALVCHEQVTYKPDISEWFQQTPNNLASS